MRNSTAVGAILVLLGAACSGSEVRSGDPLTESAAELVSPTAADRCACADGLSNFCHHPPRTLGCPMTFPGGLCDPNGDGSYADADWHRGYAEYQRRCLGPRADACGCRRGTDNFCLYGVGVLGCGMTHRGGYCDPNGDGSFDDADWHRGYLEYLQGCGSLAPTVEYFQVAPGQVDRGGQVTVRWSTRDATLRSLWRLNPVGQIADFVHPLPPRGDRTLSLPSYHVDRATFVLWLQGEDGRSMMVSTSVQVRCPYAYFFGTPTQESCPLAPAATESAVVQTFEGGYLLTWPSQDQVLALLHVGARVERRADHWTPGWPPPAWSPPPGRFAPEGPFAKVWAEDPSLAQVLGWATSRLVPHPLIVQRSGAYRYARTYFALNDGRVVYVVESTWGRAR